MASNTRIQLEKWLSKIEVKADKVLDIGGSQLPVRGRTKNWMVKDYKILDLPNPHEAKIKPDYNWDINYELNNNVDAPKIVEDYTKNKGKFDIVFCLEVMEYIWNPVTALRNIGKIVKGGSKSSNGGILYISFPFIYPHHNPIGEDCLRYTKWGVLKLLREADFKILDIKPRVLEDDRKGLLKLYANEGMRPAKLFKGHNEVGYLCKCRRLWR